MSYIAAEIHQTFGFVFHIGLLRGSSSSEAAKRLWFWGSHGSLNPMGVQKSSQKVCKKRLRYLNLCEILMAACLRGSGS